MSTLENGADYPTSWGELFRHTDPCNIGLTEFKQAIKGIQDVSGVTPVRIHNPGDVSINSLGRSISHWADGAFPDRTDQSMYLKMYGEMAEMIDATTQEQLADEVADVLIMILDFATRRGVDIQHAIKTKMEINRKRTWVSNKNGVFRHTGD